MKKLLFALLFGAFIIASSGVYAQDGTKSTEKSGKVIKKAAKGKNKKAMKKDEKMQKKEDKAK
jgi:hypothetical protein